MAPTIMLVDDDHASRIITKTLLQKNGYDIVECKSGTEAVVRYMKTPCPVVLMDCGMPNMDGFTTTESIRLVEREQSLSPAYIIALTGQTHIDYRTQCKQVGMNDFLEKPFRAESLLLKLDIIPEI